MEKGNTLAIAQHAYNQQGVPTHKGHRILLDTNSGTVSV